MRTDFAYINDVVEAEVVAEERGERIRAVSDEQVRVRGFPIPDDLIRPKRVDEMKAARHKVANKFRESAATLRVRLMAAGIEPIAVVPRKVWHDMCRESGLFLLAPDDHGKVLFTKDLFVKLRQLGWVCWTAIIALGFLAFAAVFAAVFFLFPNAWGVNPGIVSDGHVAAFAFTLVAAIAAWVTTCRVLEVRVGKWVYRRNVERYIAGKTWLQMLHDFAPDGKLWSGTVSAEIELPPPPLEVAKCILRAKDAELYFYVAAEPDAITLRGGLSKVFDDALVRTDPRAPMWAKEGYASHAEWLKYCPILYLESDHGDNAAVAVIAQYGEFPIEKETVDRLIKGRGLA